MGSFHTLYIHKFQVQEAARATEQTSIRRRAARFLTIDEQLPLLCHLVAMQLQHLAETFSRLPVRFGRQVWPQREGGIKIGPFIHTHTFKLGEISQCFMSFWKYHQI